MWSNTFDKWSLSLFVTCAIKIAVLFLSFHVKDNGFYTVDGHPFILFLNLLFLKKFSDCRYKFFAGLNEYIKLRFSQIFWRLIGRNYLVSTTYSPFGATCLKIFTILSDLYLQQIFEIGTWSLWTLNFHTSYWECPS